MVVEDDVGRAVAAERGHRLDLGGVGEAARVLAAEREAGVGAVQQPLAQQGLREAEQVADGGVRIARRCPHERLPRRDVDPPPGGVAAVGPGHAAVREAFRLGEVIGPRHVRDREYVLAHVVEERLPRNAGDDLPEEMES